MFFQAMHTHQCCASNTDALPAGEGQGEGPRGPMQIEWATREGGVGPAFLLAYSPSRIGKGSGVRSSSELADLELVESDEASEEGYREYQVGSYPLLVVELDRVAESERDDLLGFLTPPPSPTSAAAARPHRAQIVKQPVGVHRVGSGSVPGSGSGDALP
jgi:hypothetical protein